MTKEKSHANIVDYRTQSVIDMQSFVVPLSQTSKAVQKRRYGDPLSNAHKPVAKEEKLGQVFTSPTIADRMTKKLLQLLKGSNVLDPCVGKTAFPSALIRNDKKLQKLNFTLIDVDEAMVDATRKWLNENKMRAEVQVCDYLSTRFDGRFDGIIFNPPFIRQEWIQNKQMYLSLFKDRYGISLPGTSNLYVYFVAKAIHDLRDGGVFCCILYDSWQSTRFGIWLDYFLRSNCLQLSVENVLKPPFEGRLINATIVTGIKAGNEMVSSLPNYHTVTRRSSLADLDGFVPLSKVFATRRGLRLKQANFFLCRRADMGRFGAVPFIKKIGMVKGFIVPDDHDEAAIIITDSCNLAARRELMRRLACAKEHPHSNISVLTWFKERPGSWYTHRNPPYAPLVFNYYLRHRPRHIYNPDRCYSDNFYGLSPLCDTLSALGHLAMLNSSIVCSEIMEASRNQGSGLFKIQLFEYRQAFIPDPRFLQRGASRQLNRLGRELVTIPSQKERIIHEIDCLIEESYPSLRQNGEKLKKTNYLIAPMAFPKRAD